LLHVALPRLLDWWRDTRDAELGDLVAKLTPVERRAYPKSASVHEQQTRWLQLADTGDPAMLPSLVALLHDGYSNEVLARLQTVLARFDDDPRTSAAVTRLYESPAHINLSTLPLWEALGNAVVRFADPRAAAALDRVLALGNRWVGLFKPHMRPKMWPHVVEVRRRLAAALAEKRPSLSTAQRAELAQLQPPRSEEELLAAIYAQPDADAPRAVYADFLAERGDPRGEFIALQLDGKNAQRLLDNHIHKWLGPFADVTIHKLVEFERGFPATITLRADVSRRAASAVIGLPGWATVHTVRLSSRTDVPVTLLAHPSMARLRAVEGIAAADLHRLWRAGHALYWERVAVLDPLTITADALADVRVFPALVEVKLKPLVDAHVEALLARRPALTIKR
jgi:uncharacterized protein (TIGR02996 family)